MLYNIYCDESCHLQNDRSSVMVLGAMYCPREKKQQIYSDIRAIKKKYGLSSYFEIKWTKVSESRVEFYLDLLDYFWKTDSLYYRGLVATEKDQLDHAKFNEGDYDLWYYKMYYLMLDSIICQDDEYYILLDIKDTRGGKRVQKLKEVLCNKKHDFNEKVIKHIGQINSRESEILQLADLFNGALTYHYRRLEEDEASNHGKVAFVEKLRAYQNIDTKTPAQASKFNLFIWSPQR